MNDYRWWCKHYNGVGNSITCQIGVLYSGVKAEFAERPIVRYPCYDREIDTCDKREHLTDDEWQASEDATRKSLADYLENIKNDICPHCKQPIKRKRQVGRCVYALPCCNHRLYQGRLNP